MKRDEAPALDEAVPRGQAGGAERPGVRWPARLELRARRDGPATRLHAAHEGPLRLLKTLYPEGQAIAHAVLVHPPGGLVGGDRLDVDLHVGTGAHLLVTNPAATRFYRSVAGVAAQRLTARVAAGARLEWLPQETLAYDGCDAQNAWRVRLDGDASLLAMEVLALGLGASGRPFLRGRFEQRFEIAIERTSKVAVDSGMEESEGARRSGRDAGESAGSAGIWRERGIIAAGDHALLDGPCGLAGHRVLGTLVFAAGEVIAPAMAEAALEAARGELGQGAGAAPGLLGGATHLHGRLLVLRVLAHEVEPAMRLLRRVRGLWRQRCWGLAAHEPRIWAS